MLESIKEVPVTFEPNWTDEWLVWLTAASVVASAVLGLLAYRNGVKATQIASASAERDTRQRQELADMQAAEFARQAKARRYEFGATLRRTVNDLLMAGDVRSDDEKRRSYLSLDRISSRTGESTAEALRGYVVQRAYFAKEAPMGNDIRLGTIGETFDLIGKWVEDPNSVEINVEEAWRDTLKLVEKLKSVAGGNDTPYQDLLDSLDESA